MAKRMPKIFGNSHATIAIENYLTGCNKFTARNVEHLKIARNS